MHFNFHIHAGRQAQIGQIFDRFGCRFDDVDQAFMYAHLVLVARVFMDYESLERDAADSGNEAKTREQIARLLDDLKHTVNSQVSAFSKLSRVIEQVEPFEKTPTQKIKRYLYA